MAYKSRYARRVVRKSRRNLIATIIICVLLLYATITWILPSLVNGVGILKGLKKVPTQSTQSVSENTTLAPPVINIPYEATNSAQIRISGYATADTKVKIYINDELQDTTTSDETGSFTSNLVSLNMGTNTIYGKTVDDKNNDSLASKEITLTYDNQKPNLNLSSPSDGQQITGGDKKVTVSGSTDPNDQLFINGSLTVINSDGSFSVTTPINEGDNTISVRAEDQSGNSTEIDRKVTWKSS